MIVTIVRYVTTGILAGLTAASAYYPHVLWLPIAIATLSTLGVNVVPSITQGSAASRRPSPSIAETDPQRMTPPA